MMWNRNQKRWAVTNLLSTAMIEDLSGKNLLVTRSKRKRIVEQEKECKDTDLEWQIFDMIVDEIHAVNFYVNFHESSIIRDYYEPCGWIFSHFIIHSIFYSYTHLVLAWLINEVLKLQVSSFFLQDYISFILIANLFSFCLLQLHDYLFIPGNLSFFFLQLLSFLSLVT